MGLWKKILSTNDATKGKEQNGQIITVTNY